MNNYINLDLGSTDDSDSGGFEFHSVFSSSRGMYSKRQAQEIDDLWDIDKLATYLMVSAKTIYAWIENDMLNHNVFRRLGSRKLVFFPDAVKEAILNDDLIIKPIKERFV